MMGAICGQAGVGYLACAFNKPSNYGLGADYYQLFRTPASPITHMKLFRDLLHNARLLRCFAHTSGQQLRRLEKLAKTSTLHSAQLIWLTQTNYKSCGTSHKSSLCEVLLILLHQLLALQTLSGPPLQQRSCGRWPQSHPQQHQHTTVNNTVVAAPSVPLPCAHPFIPDCYGVLGERAAPWSTST